VSAPGAAGAPAIGSAEPAVPRPASSQGALSTTLTGRTYGDPPPGRFGGLPLSELAIFFGAIAVVVGLVRLHEHHPVGPVLIVGVVVCVLGVMEVTAREHFAGYRSHTTLLAGIPAVGVGIALIALVGGSLSRGTLLLVVLPVFGILFWLLRKRFINARQGRLVKPPVP